LTLLAAFSLSTITAVSAFAGEHEGEGWLVEGKPITEAEGALTSENETEVALEDAKAPIIGKAAVLCKFILDGTVGPEVGDEIKQVLTIAKEAVPEERNSLLKCLKITGCEETTEASPISVWPKHLPWLTELEGMETEPELLDRLFGAGSGKEPAWVVVCLALGVSEEDQCEGSTSVKVSEGTSEKTISEEFNPASPIGSQTTTCSLGGPGAGTIQGGGLLKLISTPIIGVLLCFPFLTGKYDSKPDCLAGKNPGTYKPGWVNIEF
jgi:hypothetical protein